MREIASHRPARFRVPRWRRRWAWPRPRTLVTGLVLLVVLLGLGGFALLAAAQRHAVVEEERSRAADLAVLLAEHAGRLLDAADVALLQVAAVPEGRSWDEVERSTAAYETLRGLSTRLDFVGAFWLTDETGRPRLTSREFPAPAIDTSNRPYFVEARAGRTGPLLSGLMRSRYKDEANFVVARRIAGPDDSFRGIAQAVIEPAYFFDFYRSLDLAPGTEVVIARGDGLLVVGYPQDLSDAAVGRKLPPERLLAGATGRPEPFVYTSGADGTRRIGAARWVSGFPVLVQVGLPAGQAVATWRRTVLGEGGLLAAALAAVMALGHLAARRATREEKLSAELEARVEIRTAELQAALAAKEVLLREVNHRVTNNLQLVSSLLGMQHGRTTSEEVRRQLDDTRARIHSIAGLHRALYANGSHDAVDMPAYLRAIARDLGDSLGHDGAPRPVLVEAEPLRLPAEAAVALGLIANELATNAVKHAYAVGEEGPVTIRLRPEADRIRLEVADGGRGLPPGFDPAAGGGLGMRLVLALTRQLRGTLTAGDTGPGAMFAVELPLPGGPPQASTKATA